MHEHSRTQTRDAVDAAAGAPPDPSRPRPRRRGELAALGLVGVLLIAALAAGGAALYREFYSPTAFVLRYLDLLARGDAADALTVPGVRTQDTGDGAEASDALLRRAALRTLTDIEAVSEEAGEGRTLVTVAYRAADVDASTTFAIAQDGWIGVAPAWRFAQSPLAVIDLTVRGAMSFEVNGFEVDKRQVSPAGADADPLAPVSMAVFSPGLYSVSVDTPIASTPGVAVLADAPGARVSVEIQAEATDEFVGVVQERVEEFLTACATQQVLQPTGCPFGFEVSNRIVDLPAWSIVRQPEVRVAPDGAGWAILPAEAVAHIHVPIRSLFDGSIRQVSEDVTFTVDGSIEVLPDGSASITVGGGA